MAGATQERRLLGIACKRVILIEAPSSTYHRGMLVVGNIPKKRRRPMRFSTTQHPFDYGIDLQARTMYICSLHQESELMLHRNMQASPETFLKASGPSRDVRVVAVACLFP
jgi:hypothetical protein